jgi:RNA polymerase sigma-70 factor (ECF subfamily)
MSDISSGDLTRLLRAWSQGDEGALEKLTPVVYRELYRLAGSYMGRERPGHTLQATALVNEAYVRLMDWKNVKWQNRAHFFGVSAQLMRRILVDYARSRGYAKRGGGAHAVLLEDAEASQAVADNRLGLLLEVDIALERLGAVDPQLARVVELRYFGGLSVEETAEALNVSRITVIRHWNFARAWLLRELGQGAPNGTATPAADSDSL